jgi:hypothetical protein
VPIEEDEEWADLDPMTLRTSTEEDKWCIQQGQTAIQLHYDREPRFYGSLFIDRGTFFGNGKYTTDTEPFYALLMNSHVASDRYSTTGYLCKKLVCLAAVCTNTFNGDRYSFPIIRLADLYLMYAEALNECLPSPESVPSAEIYSYIDAVRTRTGLEPVVDSWGKYAIDSKKSKPLTKNGLREIIRRERLNELAFEGARFWDLRRWKIAEEYMNKPVRGFDIRTKTAEDFYQIREIYPLKFEKKDYFWPIRVGVLLRNKNLKQNPGWESN